MTFSKFQEFQDHAALLSALSTMNVHVPGRAEGRMTSHTEAWIFHRLLQSLAERGRLKFPLSITYDDRPDFMINEASGDSGFEITEAIPENFAEYCTLAEREFPGTPLDSAHFKRGARRISVPRLRTMLETGELTSDGWAGNRPEIDWALDMLDVMGTKLKKLAKPGFQLGDINVLVIYDNMPQPHIELDVALKNLAEGAQPLWDKEPGFEVVYVIHGPVLVEIRKTHINSHAMTPE